MELLLSQESMSRSNSEFMSHHDLPTTGHFHSAIAFGPASVISIDMTGQCASRRSQGEASEHKVAQSGELEAMRLRSIAVWLRLTGRTSRLRGAHAEAP
jgi:hypothetical protein